MNYFSSCFLESPPQYSLENSISLLQVFAIIASMESTILPPDNVTHIIGFELTPIEANSARRYKRVALVIPLANTGQDLVSQTLLIQQYVLSIFSEAVALWPILGGSITSGETSGQLTIQAPLPDLPAKQRDDLVNIQNTLSDTIEAEAEALMLQVKNKKLNGIFFPTDCNRLDTGLPPLLMKLTIFDNLLVLGFSFYEVVADNAFISHFISSMIDSYWDHPGRLGSYSYRMPLEPIVPTDDTRNRFPFYDWSDKPTAQLTPSDKLACQLIEIKNCKVQHFIKYLCKPLRSNQSTRDPCPKTMRSKDYIAAILWAIIIKVRHLQGKLEQHELPRMNILLPGEPRVRQNRDWSYFGSSMVPTVALSNNALGPRCRFRDYRSILDCGYTIKWISDAAISIRRAIDGVDAHYIQQLMGLKQTLSAEEDSAAYERGIDRSTTGTTLEDWTDFYARGSKSTGIPFTDTSRPMRVLPCADDLEEGKIILLSQFKASDHKVCEARCLAWLCLEADTMKLVRKWLDAEGWIFKGESPGITDMTNPEWEVNTEEWLEKGGQSNNINNDNNINTF